MAKITIVWDILAKSSFKKHIRYIAEDSIQNADKVRLDILSMIDLLPENPKKFPIDRFKVKNDGR